VLKSAVPRELWHNLQICFTKPHSRSSSSSFRATMNNFGSRHNLIKYSLLISQYVRRECFIYLFLEWIRTGVTSTDEKTIQLVHNERALLSTTYWKWPSGSF